MKDNVILYTGNGGGKTTSALGLALRAAGHKKKTVMIQFMKGRKDIGEYMAKDLLAPHFEMRQFGREGFVDLENPSEEDKKLAREGLAYSKDALSKKPFLLVLDEVNLAAATGLLDKEDVLSLLDSVPAETIAVLTGRYAPDEFRQRADYVVEINDIKRPKRNIPPRAGFEY